MIDFFKFIVMPLFFFFLLLGSEIGFLASFKIQTCSACSFYIFLMRLLQRQSEICFLDIIQKDKTHFLFMLMISNKTCVHLKLKMKRKPISLYYQFYVLCLLVSCYY